MDYEPVVVDGVRVGWRALDRAAWRAPIARVDARPVDVVTRSLEAIFDDLEPWYPSVELRARLVLAYERAPARVSSLTTWALARCDERGPCGLLYKRLGQLRDGDT